MFRPPLADQAHSPRTCFRSESSAIVSGRRDGISSRSRSSASWGTAGDAHADQLTAGYALQRVLLTITDLGLAVSMLSQPIEVAAAREQLRLALGRFGAPQMVLRIGYGQPGAMTARRDPAEVIDTVPV